MSHIRLAPAAAGSKDNKRLTTGWKTDNQDRFSVLPPELRCLIYSHLTLPTVTYIKVYPVLKDNPKIRIEPILQVNKQIRQEATPFIYRNTRLILVPRYRFILPGMLRSMAAAMPMFGRHVAFLRVMMIAKTPKSSFKVRHGLSNDTRFAFEMERRVFKVTASAPEQYCDFASAEAQGWVRKTAGDLKTVMLEILEGGHEESEKRLIEKVGSPFLEF